MSDAYVMLPIQLLLADLDEALPAQTAGVADSYLLDLYGNRLVEGFQAGIVDGAHAREHLMVTATAAYLNLGGVALGPHAFFNIIDNDTDWSIRSRRGGLWQSKNLEATWLKKHVAGMYPNVDIEIYGQRWGLLQTLLGEHLEYLLRLCTRKARVLDPKPSLLAMDVWTFCLWYADPDHKPGSFIPRR